MPYIDLVPQGSNSLAWSNTVWAKGEEDNLYTTCAAGSGQASAILRLYDFSNLKLPINTEIVGLQVLVKAKTDSSSSTAYLAFNYFISAGTNNSWTTVSTGVILTTSLSTSGQYYTVPSSTGSTWGFELRRYDLWRHTFSSGYNRYFGITCRASGDTTVNRQIDNIIVRVHYRTLTYLHGSRSGFVPRDPHSQDVILNSTGSPIPLKYNSVDKAMLIKSEDMNLLGDAVYNTERVLKNAEGLVRTFGGASRTKMFALSLTCTGAVTAGLAPARVFYAYAKPTASVGTTTLTENLVGSITFTKAPNIKSLGINLSPPKLNLFNTKAIAWVIPSTGGANVPVLVSCNGVHVRHAATNDNTAGPDYTFGFVVLGDYFGTITPTSVLGSEQLRGSSLAPAPLGVEGTLVVKLMSIGFSEVF